MSLRTRLVSFAACGIWLICSTDGRAQSSGDGNRTRPRPSVTVTAPGSRLGYLHPVADRDEIRRLRNRQNVRYTRPMKRLYYGENTSHVANGTSLRNRVSGYIQLRG